MRETKRDICVPTVKDERKYTCSVCGKPAEQGVSWFQRGGEWHKYIHYVRNTCDCWKKLNA
jgi:hypothetical protein